ncbi:MAG: FkbM family methyltransferase [Pseudomonadota bacterium]
MPQDQTPAVAATCHGVKVPASPHVSEARAARLEAGRYERQEINGALQLVGPEDRVLELGAGIGVVGAVIAHNRKPERVLSFEANPRLIPHIEALYAMNGLSDRISVRNQVVLAGEERPETIEFFFGKSFLGSGIDKPKRGSGASVDVPTVAYADIVAELKPTVLVIDIEGAEHDLLRHADLSGVRGIVVELHPAVYGVEGMRACKRTMRKAGFRRIEEASTRTVYVTRRDP